MDQEPEARPRRHMPPDEVDLAQRIGAVYIIGALVPIVVAVARDQDPGESAWMWSAVFVAFAVLMFAMPALYPLLLPGWEWIRYDMVDGAARRARAAARAFRGWAWDTLNTWRRALGTTPRAYCEGCQAQPVTNTAAAAVADLHRATHDWRRALAATLSRGIAWMQRHLEPHPFDDQVAELMANMRVHGMSPRALAAHARRERLVPIAGPPPWFEPTLDYLDRMAEAAGARAMAPDARNLELAGNLYRGASEMLAATLHALEDLDQLAGDADKADPLSPFDYDVNPAGVLVPRSRRARRAELRKGARAMSRRLEDLAAAFAVNVGDVARNITEAFQAFGRAASAGYIVAGERVRKLLPEPVKASSLNPPPFGGVPVVASDLASPDALYVVGEVPELNLRDLRVAVPPHLAPVIRAGQLDGLSLGEPPISPEVWDAVETEVAAANRRRIAAEEERIVEDMGRDADPDVAAAFRVVSEVRHGLGDVLLLSIRSRFASRLWDGTKRVEVRRTRPRYDTRVVVVYEPEAKAITGVARVRRLLAEDTGGEVDFDGAVTEWAHGLEPAELDAYLGTSPTRAACERAYGLELDDITRLAYPLPLSAIDRTIKGGPQSYRYLTEHQRDRFAVALAAATVAPKSEGVSA